MREADVEKKAAATTATATDAAAQQMMHQLGVLRANGLLRELHTTSASRESMGADLVEMLAEQFAKEAVGFPDVGGGDVELELLVALGLTEEQAKAAVTRPRA
jgi:hypothetical protein